MVIGEFNSKRDITNGNGLRLISFGISRNKELVTSRVGARLDVVKTTSTDPLGIQKPQRLSVWGDE